MTTFYINKLLKCQHCLKFEQIKFNFNACLIVCITYLVSTTENMGTFNALTTGALNREISENEMLEQCLLKTIGLTCREIDEIKDIRIFVAGTPYEASTNIMSIYPNEIK